MTIDLKPEYSHLIDQAIQAGLIERPDEVVEVGLEALRRRLEAAVSSAPPITADEWMRKFQAWAHSHPTTTPLLSDEAISRESIYRERGL